MASVSWSGSGSSIPMFLDSPSRTNPQVSNCCFPDICSKECRPLYWPVFGPFLHTRRAGFPPDKSSRLDLLQQSPIADLERFRGLPAVPSIDPQRLQNDVPLNLANR